MVTTMKKRKIMGCGYGKEEERTAIPRNNSSAYQCI